MAATTADPRYYNTRLPRCVIHEMIVHRPLFKRLQSQQLQRTQAAGRCFPFWTTCIYRLSSRQRRVTALFKLNRCNDVIFDTSWYLYNFLRPPRSHSRVGLSTPAFPRRNSLAKCHLSCGHSSCDTTACCTVVDSDSALKYFFVK
jgi:hypothetical protein